MKAAFAERKDVIYKTLLRNIRRFLWKKFSQDNKGIRFSKRTRGWLTFKAKLDIFYKEYFQKSSDQILPEEGIEESLMKEILASFMSSIIILPKRNEITKKWSLAISKAIKRFSIEIYSNLFEIRESQLFFKIMRDSGIFDEILNSWSNLQMSMDAYNRAINSVIEYNIYKSLIK